MDLVYYIFRLGVLNFFFVILDFMWLGGFSNVIKILILKNLSDILDIKIINF